MKGLIILSGLGVVAGLVFAVAGSGEKRGSFREPEAWVNGELPFLDEVEIEADLRRGEWKVLIFDHGCPKCLDVLEETERAVTEGRERVPVACLELPPHEEDDRERDVPLTFGRVRKEAHLTTPVFVWLRDGLVTRVETYSARTAPARGDLPLSEERLSADLGYLAPGAVEEVEYVVTNRSSAPLAFTKIRPECACTQVTRAPETIEPGRSGRVEVTFEALEKPMVYAKGIVLETTDPERREIRLELRARIGLPLRAQPDVLDFGVVEPGAKREGRVTIRNEGSEPVSLLYSTSAGGELTVQVPREPVRPGWSVTVPVKLRASKGDGAQGKELRVLAHVRTSPPGPHLEVAARYEVGQD